MEEVINLSSDEDDKDKENDALKVFLSNIVKKYDLFNSPKSEEASTIKNCNDISSSDDETVEDVPKKTVRKGSDNPNKNVQKRKSSDDPNKNVQKRKSSDDPNKIVRKRKSSDDPGRLLDKMRAQQEKLRKKEEREQAKAESVANKAKKLALATAYKNLKPEECLKFITALIDINLSSSELGSEIPTSLAALNVNFKTVSQILPNTITWSRQVQTQLIPTGLGFSQEKTECDELIYILKWDKLIQHVNEKDLCEYFVSRQSIVPTKRITIGIYGLKKYLKSHKSKQFEGYPKVGRKQVDAALSEVQIMTGCSHRLLESPEDVGNMIGQFSKSIGQMPYKLERQAKSDEMEWYVAGCNKDCVRVDKSGNGLFSLWRQQLTQFSLARLETADAVCSVYPSPARLMEAYDDCGLRKEKEDLLKDIPIRRAAGPLNNVRKLGPELSKKICAVYTSYDGDTVV